MICIHVLHQVLIPIFVCNQLRVKMISTMNQNTLEFAREMDEKDPLKSFREKFFFPNFHDNEVVYFQTNEKNMSYQYICCLCYTTWTNK